MGSVSAVWVGVKWGVGCYTTPMPPSSGSLDLGRIATAHRLSILHMVQQAGAGHIGGSLSIIDILTVLYYAGFVGVKYYHTAYITACV